MISLPALLQYGYTKTTQKICSNKTEQLQSKNNIQTDVARIEKQIIHVAWSVNSRQKSNVKNKVKRKTFQRLACSFLGTF